MEDNRFFRLLIARGTAGRLELSASVYAIVHTLERLRTRAEDRADLLPDLNFIEDFIIALARGFGLEVYLGTTSTDAYGVTCDVEAGSQRVSRGLKWGREVPFRRIWIPLTDEESVELGVRVDRHRARGRGVTVRDMRDILGERLCPRVEETLLDAAEDARDLEELWQIQAAALEAQSIERINILAASYPALVKLEE